MAFDGCGLIIGGYYIGIFCEAFDGCGLIIGEYYIGIFLCGL